MAVMLITTVLVTLIMIAKWRASLLICIPFLFFFVFIEGVFLGSTMYKVPSGGWFPIAVSFVVVIIMCVWWAGQYARRRLMVKNAKETNTANFIKLVRAPCPSPAPSLRAPPSLPAPDLSVESAKQRKADNTADFPMLICAAMAA
eukprot:186126-Chlamydomonas_euryale.AAC.1